MILSMADQTYLQEERTADSCDGAQEGGTLSPEQLEDLKAQFNLVHANGVALFVDSRTDVELPPDAQRVYPFTDEASQLFLTAKRVVEQDGEGFDRVVDGFAGGGNSMLPMLQAGIAKHGLGIELNPRAVCLAESNARLNGLQETATFMQADVHNLHDAVTTSGERTLYMANPPFALMTQEKGKWAIDGILDNERLMRDGGRDGLKLTRAYVTQSLARAYAAESLEHAKTGDVIIGVAYSRIGTDNHIELETELREMVGNRGSFSVELIEGETLWRGPNGRKEQPNPMPLSSMRVKGVTEEQKTEYDHAAASHLAEGYDRLGYYRYVIRVGQIGSNQEETRDKTGRMLRQ